ncbi:MULTISPECIES: hypothetical protein [Rhodopseudomonas]|nr:MULTISPECIES: hypothetical protein [Rhodopseudomonas]
MGPDRMVWLETLFRAKCPPLLDDALEEALFDSPGRFRASPAFRAGMEKLLNDGTPLEMLVDSSDTGVVTLPGGRLVDENYPDRSIAFVMRKAGVLPPSLTCAFADTAPAPQSPLLWRWWTGDGLWIAGWATPSPPRLQRRPEREWPALNI